MKTIFLILLSTIIVGTTLAQTGFYVGYENGGKWDKWHYINSKGFALNEMQLDGVFGGYFGYKHKSYSVESGLYGYYTNSPMINYDYSTGQISKSMGSFGSSNMNSWVVPIRFGKDFLFLNKKIFIKPELSFFTIIARNHTAAQPNGSWGENISIPGDTTFIPTSADSTIGYTYRTSKVNFGLESSISIGYRFKEKADIYIKGSYCSSFSPILYETITHYSNAEIVKATDTFYGNSFLVQIGLRYYFAKCENKE